MDKDVVTLKVVTDKGVHYFHKLNSNGGPIMQEGYHNATGLDLDNPEEVIKLYQYLVKQNGKDAVSLVRVQVAVRETTMDLLDKDEFLEARRKIALAKLQIDDVEALGLQKLAAYNKLRYHNTDDRLVV